MATLNGVKHQKNLVPESKYSIKCPYFMTPKKITIHNTDNSASAKNEITNMRNNNLLVSFHIAIDEAGVWQGLPFNRNGWHAGDGGNGYGNRNTVGVEMSRSYDRNRNTTNLVDPLKQQFKETIKNTIKVVAQLCVDLNIVANESNIRQHQDWSGKYCPRKLLNDNEWRTLLNGIIKEYNRLKGTAGNTSTNTSKPKPKPKPKPQPVKNYLQMGDTGPAVKKLQQDLKKLGFSLGKYGADSIFGKVVRSAVIAFQLANGLTPDGVYGVKSKAVMAGKPKGPIKANLKVDGFWGTALTRALQKYFNSTVDGVLSGQYANSITNALTLNTAQFTGKKTGSVVIKKLQAFLGVKQDGFLGPETIGALQAHLGTYVDKVISSPSAMVEELQRRLNAGQL